MELAKLFDMQRVLDERIIREKGLEGKDLLPMKILALQVELGELANEWRGFKFWSKNQEPTTERDLSCGCPRCEGCQEPGNPLLEEYVDCLHFILSIGLRDEDFQGHGIYWVEMTKAQSVEKQFRDLFNDITDCFRPEEDGFHEKVYLEPVIDKFIGLGEMLGFTWEQIEAAYMNKNKVNHERQKNGY